MTLINIYGEVPGDMDDILQTSVHAFLRMNRVEISPSCRFVHQNAGSNAKSDIGRTKFTQKLNRFTVNAASEEHCEGQYDTFNDVIKFDDQKDVHHFPGLWKGDPPMAPVNRGYSHSAQTLKLSCIEDLDKRLTKGQIHLSTFLQRVVDLWDALLKENFVFSFKNTLEITAYNSLETEYGKWEWTFLAGMLEWEQKAENEIRAANPEAIPDLVKRKHKDLKVQVQKLLYEPLKSKMDKFFEGRQAEILVQWKRKFERRLINLSIELQEHAEKHCKTLHQGREAISKIEGEQNEYAKEITKKVHEYIASLRQDQEKLNHNLKRQKLEISQLEELLSKELFTPAKLVIYERKGLLTPEKIGSIKEVIQRSGGALTQRTDLQSILVQILEIDQVKRILKIGLKTEEELKIKFNLIWAELVDKISFMTQECIDVEAEVEGKLTAFVRSSKGQLIALLQKKSLAEADSLELVLEKDTHYSIRSGYTIIPWIVRLVSGKPVEIDNEALDTTDRVFNAARDYLAEIEKKDTDFNTAYTQELLHVLDEKITKETTKVKQRLSFTHEYRLDVYLTACGYAIPKFKKMSESFRKRHDSRLYLETHIKGPLFTKFKNQYYQAEAEEAIANTLCAHLEEPIRMQVRNKLGSKMVGLMKISDQFFSSKMALKVKILTDLHEQDKFELYMHYIEDVKGYLEQRLKHYTIKFCDEKVHGGSTKLQETAKQEVTKLVKFVEGKVSLDYLGETDVRPWVTVILEDTKLKGELGALDLNPGDLLADYVSLKLDLNNLKGQIGSGLKQLEERLHASFDNIQCRSEMSHWKDKPHGLLESLIGCTQQCPFCSEQCDLLDPNHVATGRPHSVAVHRSTCLKGYQNAGTKVIAMGFCPAYISGKEHAVMFSNADTHYESCRFVDYQLTYPDWSIPPDVTSEDSLYWKMFVGNSVKAIADHYIAKPATVPVDWSKITWEEVRKDLRQLYKY